MLRLLLRDDRPSGRKVGARRKICRRKRTLPGRRGERIRIFAKRTQLSTCPLFEILIAQAQCAGHDTELRDGGRSVPVLDVTLRHPPMGEKIRWIYLERTAEIIDAVGEQAAIAEVRPAVVVVKRRRFELD